MRRRKQQQLSLHTLLFVQQGASEGATWRPAEALCCVRKLQLYCVPVFCVVVFFFVSFIHDFTWCFFPPAAEEFRSRGLSRGFLCFQVWCSGVQLSSETREPQPLRFSQNLQLMLREFALKWGQNGSLAPPLALLTHLSVGCFFFLRSQRDILFSKEEARSWEEGLLSSQQTDRQTDTLEQG